MMPCCPASLARSWVMIAALWTGSALALELPLPPPGDDVVGQIQVIKTRYEDTFADLGKANDLGYEEMVSANPGVNAWVPGRDTDVILPTRYILPSGPREGIVINLAEYRMYYYPKGRNVVYTYPLGIGREGWHSPVTSTKIVAKQPNPAWYPPKSIRDEHAADGDILPTVVPPGPDNPLGPFKFSLAAKGYLIHGSNKKFGIGMRVSHGCFRMLNNNVLELAQLAPVGTSVRIINEPYKYGVSEGRVYLEAHPPLTEGANVESASAKHLAAARAFFSRPDMKDYANVDWAVAQDVISAGDGIPVAVGDMQTEPGALAASEIPDVINPAPPVAVPEEDDEDPLPLPSASVSHSQTVAPRLQSQQPMAADEGFEAVPPSGVVEAPPPVQVPLAPIPADPNYQPLSFEGESPESP